MDRRRFMLASAGTLGSLSFLSAINKTFAAELESQVNRVENMSIDESATDEDFWGWVRESFTVSPNMINLNNGGVSPSPKVVQDAHIRYYQYCNEAPSYYMWRILDAGREGLRLKLADICGVSAEEICINRNSTEGLNSIIFGLNLKAGDEVVLNKYDYPNMMNAWKQREKRDGIKLVWVEVPQPTEDDKTIIDIYTKAMTSKTKVVHVTHMVNWSGNIYPVKAIADMAHAKGAEVIVDAAHSFGQFEFKLSDTGADYLAVSLHKWLHAPLGSGLLYIKKDKIKNIWPLLSAPNPESDDIRKFENLGTRNMASEMAIGAAVDFHNVIGIKRKEARLRYLKDHWLSKASKLKGAVVCTSMKPQYSCAIGNIGFEGWKANDIEGKLYEKQKIHVTSIILEKINGIRVTPSVYTNLYDLNLLVKGLTDISELKPPTAGK